MHYDSVLVCPNCGQCVTKTSMPNRDEIIAVRQMYLGTPHLREQSRDKVIKIITMRLTHEGRRAWNEQQVELILDRLAGIGQIPPLNTLAAVQAA